MNPLDPQPHVPPQDVPVFNCVVHVLPRDAAGIVVARVANLAGLEGRGRSEREAIAQAVAAFKSAVAGRVAAHEPIPFIEPASLPNGAVQRLIAVHL